MKIVLALFAFLPGALSVAAQDRWCITHSSNTEKVAVDGDTLYIVSAMNTLDGPFCTAEIQASFLFRKTGDRIDTLIQAIPDTNIIDIFYATPGKFNLDIQIDEILYGQWEEDEDSTHYRYSTNTGIFHLGEGFFVVSNCYWAYTGGAHGGGDCTYSHYDAKSERFFTFDDVFSKGAALKVYEWVVAEIQKENPGYLVSEEEHELAMETLYLTDKQYTFSTRGLKVFCQMYDTLFGFMHEGYTYSEYLVPYAHLKKCLKKDSPIARIIK